MVKSYKIEEASLKRIIRAVLASERAFQSRADRWRPRRNAFGSSLFWAKAQENWTYDGAYPGSGEPYVRAKRCRDHAGTNETGDTLKIWLPRAADQDPNVIAGDVLLCGRAGGERAAVSDYLDLAVGSKIWWGATTIPRGWACMDGTANAVGNGGSGLSVVDYFLLCTCSAGQVGASGGSDTGVILGSSIASLLSNHAADNTGYAATGITIADHPDHIHEVDCTCQLGTQTAPFTGPWAFTNQLGNDTTIQKTTGGGSLTLSHPVTEPNSGTGHRHTTPSYAHSGSGQINLSLVNPYKKLRLIERLDNSA